MRAISPRPAAQGKSPTASLETGIERAVPCQHKVEMSAFAPSRDVRGCVDQRSAEDAEDDAAARTPLTSARRASSTERHWERSEPPDPPVRPVYPAPLRASRCGRTYATGGGV